MARKTRAEAQITRQRILGAARAIFLAHGFAGSSLQQVAEAVGLTRGAIYWHFTNKKQLLQALMLRAPSREQSNDSKDKDDEPASALMQLAMAPLERLRLSTPVRQALDLPTEAGLSVDAVAMGYKMYGEQRALLLQELHLACENVYRQRGIEAGPSSIDAARGLTWLIEGLMWRWTRDPGAFDLLGVGNLAISAYLQGMDSPGGSQGLPVPTSGHTEPGSSAAVEQACSLANQSRARR